MTTDSYSAQASEKARAAAEAESSAALAAKSRFSGEPSQTVQNIASASAQRRAATAAATLLGIMNDYSAAANEAALKNNRNLAGAALYTAKARLALWKNEYSYKNEKAKTENQRVYNAVHKAALDDKLSAYMKYNKLRADNLSEKIGALK